MVENLDKVRSAIVVWNKDVYENIFERKKFLTTELIRIQRILEWCSSDNLRKRKLDVKQELKDILKHEEILWFQKSRSTWLGHGDRNTKYFHSRTLS